MSSRRDFLRGTVGTTVAITAAGCSLFGGNEQTQTEDELVTGIADPAGQIQPAFFSGYRYQTGDLVETVDLSAVTPGIGSDFVQILDEQISGAALSDVETLTGSRVRSRGIAGGGLSFTAPSGQSLIVSGEFDSDPFVTWLSDMDLDSLGEQNGYQRFTTGRGETNGFEAFAVAEGMFIATAHSDVGFDPEDALDLQIDHQQGGESTLAKSVPDFADIAAVLDDGAMQAATSYALIPLGADTGTQAFDTVTRGIVAGGLSASPGSETDIHRAVSYLDTQMESESALTGAFTASEADKLADEEWSTNTEGSIVSARATVGETPNTAMLQSPLPIPGYKNLWNPIDPTKLGRDSPPVVSFQPSITNDGLLQIEHVGGSTVEDLLVRYVSDGTVQRESWAGPISQGGQFGSEKSIDDRTQAWVVWKPDTVDAAVVSRFRTPS